MTRRLNDATPADWDRLRKAHPAIERANNKADAVFNRWSPEEPEDTAIVRRYNVREEADKSLDAWMAGAEEEAHKILIEEGCTTDLDWGASEEDLINNPEHYNTGSIECIEAIEESMSSVAFKGYLKGNCMKYLWRYDYKGKQVEDLKKATWYLNRLTNIVAEENT